MATFTATELATYLGHATEPLNPRETLLMTLTLGLVDEVILDAPVSVRMKAIALEICGRAVRNVDGAATEAIDDYSFRRPDATALAGVYITDGERDELKPASVGSSRRSVVLRAYR